MDAISNILISWMDVTDQQGVNIADYHLILDDGIFSKPFAFLINLVFEIFKIVAVVSAFLVQLLTDPDFVIAGVAEVFQNILDSVYNVAPPWLILSAGFTVLVARLYIQPTKNKGASTGWSRPKNMRNGGFESEKKLWSNLGGGLAWMFFALLLLTNPLALLQRALEFVQDLVQSVGGLSLGGDQTTTYVGTMTSVLTQIINFNTTLGNCNSNWFSDMQSGTDTTLQCTGGEAPDANAMMLIMVIVGTALMAMVAYFTFFCFTRGTWFLFMTVWHFFKLPLAGTKKLFVSSDLDSPKANFDTMKNIIIDLCVFALYYMLVIFLMGAAPMFILSGSQVAMDAIGISEGASGLLAMFILGGVLYPLSQWVRYLSPSKKLLQGEAATDDRFESWTSFTESFRDSETNKLTIKSIQGEDGKLDWDKIADKTGTGKIKEILQGGQHAVERHNEITKEHIEPMHLDSSSSNAQQVISRNLSQIDNKQNALERVQNRIANNKATADDFAREEKLRSDIANLEQNTRKASVVAAHTVGNKKFVSLGELKDRKVFGDNEKLNGLLDTPHALEKRLEHVVGSKNAGKVIQTHTGADGEEHTYMLPAAVNGLKMSAQMDSVAPVAAAVAGTAVTAAAVSRSKSRNDSEERRQVVQSAHDNRVKDQEKQVTETYFDDEAVHQAEEAAQKEAVKFDSVAGSLDNVTQALEDNELHTEKDAVTAMKLLQSIDTGIGKVCTKINGPEAMDGYNADIKRKMDVLQQTANDKEYGKFSEAAKELTDSMQTALRENTVFAADNAAGKVLNTSASDFAKTGRVMAETVGTAGMVLSDVEQQQALQSLQETTLRTDTATGEVEQTLVTDEVEEPANESIVPTEGERAASNNYSLEKQQEFSSDKNGAKIQETNDAIPHPVDTNVYEAESENIRMVKDERTGQQRITSSVEPGFGDYIGEQTR